MVPPDELNAVLVAYNAALNDCWNMGVALAALLTPVALGIKRQDVRKKEEAPGKPAELPAEISAEQDEKDEEWGRNSDEHRLSRKGEDLFERR